MLYLRTIWRDKHCRHTIQLLGVCGFYAWLGQWPVCALMMFFAGMECERIGR